MRIAQLSTFAALLSVAFSVNISEDAVPTPKGWKRIWFDDFSSPHGHKRLPSSKKWAFDVGTSYPGGPAQWGTGEIQVYTASKKNVYIKGGELHIKPVRESNGGWTSARIETHRANFMAKPGHKMKIQARISIPAVNPEHGAGYWPAFWTTGAGWRGHYNNWPAVGEMDIMENVNALPSTSSTLHCGVSPGGPCNENIGLGQRSACTGSNCNGHWHTYSVVVDRHNKPESVNFYTDGSLRKKITSNDLGDAVWNQTFHHGHYILLNVAMGGQYPDGTAGFTTPTSSTKSGHPMKVKYVAVYYT